MLYILFTVNSRHILTLTCALLLHIIFLYIKRNLPYFLIFGQFMPRCVFPECGKLDEEVTPLVINGQEANYGAWPWQAGLFTLRAGNWTFWCGGSLVSEYAVVTGHCPFTCIGVPQCFVLGYIHLNLTWGTLMFLLVTVCYSCPLHMEDK